MQTETLRLFLSKFSRLGYAVVVFAFTIALLFSIIASKAFAYGQITSRGIEFSSATAGATGVTIKVFFTTATSTLIKGIVINFCDNDPLINDTCNNIADSINTSSATLSAITGTGMDTTTGNWT